jgi:hypothetical protein
VSRKRKRPSWTANLGLAGRLRQANRSMTWTVSRTPVFSNGIHTVALCAISTMRCFSIWPVSERLDTRIYAMLFSACHRSRCRWMAGVGWDSNAPTAIGTHGRSFA